MQPGQGGGGGGTNTEKWSLFRTRLFCQKWFSFDPAPEFCCSGTMHALQRTPLCLCGKGIEQRLNVVPMLRGQCAAPSIVAANGYSSVA